MGLFSVLLPLLAISGAAFSFPQRQDANSVAKLSNKFASDLHRKLSVGDNNVFFSPLSIFTALSMLFLGTRGKTADEMRRALGYQQAGLTDEQVHSAFQTIVETLSEDSSKEYMLYLANALFAQKGYPVLEEYKTGLHEIYQAEARNVDFQMEAEEALQEINSWVQEKTSNQITKLLDNVDPSTVMVLLNAVYFKGTWQTKFENTTEGIFFNRGLETERVKTPMMSYKDRVLYARLDGAQAIELPYEGEDVSMVIVLPDTLDGLSKLEQDLTPDTVTNIRRSTLKAKALVALPKFKLEYENTLNTVLQDLGVKNVFETSADLSGISEEDKLVVSQVVHKAVIEVNEEGTEASGTTGTVIVKTSMIRFVANHPFLFSIVDTKNDLVLFQGRMNKF